MPPIVNLIGADNSQLINKLKLQHPTITFTECDIHNGINVVFGEDLSERLIPGSIFRDGKKKAFNHCYVFEQPGGLFIPAYPVSSQFLEPDRVHWITHAVAKACSLSTGEAKLDPPIDFILEPTLAQVQEYVHKLVANPNAIVSVDIETIMNTAELTAIAFSYNPQHSISIPLATVMLEPYWSSEQELEIWRLIQLVLTGPNQKVFQNYIFDTMCLDKQGIQTCGELDDSMLIANLLNPELPKSLADLARIYCYCPPWKDKKDFSMTGDMKEFWRYNAQDAARTLQIFGCQLEELAQRNLDHFYYTHTKPLLPLVYDVCARGTNVDKDALLTLNVKIAALTTPIERDLAALAQPLMPFTNKIRDKTLDVRGPSPKTGKEIVLTKGYKNEQETFNPNSNKQIKEVLRTLGYKIPSFKGKETTDRRALLKLNRKQPHAFLVGLLTYGKLQKLRSTYGAIETDPDGRCRYSFNIGGTKSGRFSCQGTSWGTGLNIQTIPRRNKELDINFREIFIPDSPDETLLQVDLSQAELRVVAWLSGEEKLIHMLAQGEDVHTFMSNEIVRVLGRQADRNFGKFLNHATNYGVGAAKLCDMALDKLDLGLSIAESQSFLDVRRKTFPRIYKWHESVRAEIFRTRRLTSPHGRERYFYGFIDDETIREALSFIPQATVVDVLNDAWILLSKEEGYGTDFKVTNQCHDSLLLSVKRDRLQYTKTCVDAAFMKQYVYINGNQYLIPHDLQTGETWGTLK